MKKITRTLCALALFGALAAPAAAQDRPEAETIYDFNDHDVEGGWRSPMGVRLVVREGLGRTSLIQPRGHYVPELLKSVESL